MAENKEVQNAELASSVMKTAPWRLLLALLLFAVPVVAFTRIAYEVRGDKPIMADVQILTWLHQFSSPWLDSLAIMITNIGDAILIVLAIVMIGGYLFYHHRRRAAVFLLFGVGGAAVLNLMLKIIFERVRPDLWVPLVTEHSFSFPSGHAMASSALALSVMVLLWPTQWRWYALAVGVFYILLVGLSRIYLGVHYPTDVIGGWCVSVLWIIIVKKIIDTLPSPRKKSIVT